MRQLRRALNALGLVSVAVMLGMSLLVLAEAQAPAESKAPRDGTVVVTIVEPSQPTSCPPMPRRLMKMDNGTYLWSGGDSFRALEILCSTAERRHRQEWTDYPERGGMFIRRLP